MNEFWLYCMGIGTLLFGLFVLLILKDWFAHFAILIAIVMGFLVCSVFGALILGTFTGMRP